jgi:hypothetical protein
MPYFPPIENYEFDFNQETISAISFAKKLLRSHQNSMSLFFAKIIELFMKLSKLKYGKTIEN